MSENSTEMPQKTRKNFLQSLRAKAVQAKNKLVSATKHAWHSLFSGTKRAAIAVVKTAANGLRYIGVGILGVAQYIVIVVNTVLLWISLAIMIVLNALYKIVLAVCLALMAPHVLATGGKDAVKTDWSLYMSGWKPRNYFTLTLGEVARAEGLRTAEKQAFTVGEEEDEEAVQTPQAQQPKGHPTPRRRPHPRRTRPTVVPA